MGVGGKEAKGWGWGAPPQVWMSGDTHVAPQTTLFILVYLIFRSKLILAFNNLSRAEKSHTGGRLGARVCETSVLSQGPRSAAKPPAWAGPPPGQRQLTGRPAFDKPISPRGPWTAGWSSRSREMWRFGGSLRK